jgi:hypothetical protein
MKKQLITLGERRRKRRRRRGKRSEVI